MAMKISAVVIDVNGSFKRLMTEAPKQSKKFLSTAVFLTAAAVRRRMETTAPVGPSGEGRAPGDHISQDIEHRGRNGALSARVGIFDDPDQVAVAAYNEYAPNRQPFMKRSAEAESEGYRQRAIEALQQCERFLSQGF